MSWLIFGLSCAVLLVYWLLVASALRLASIVDDKTNGNGRIDNYWYPFVVIDALRLVVAIFMASMARRVSRRGLRMMFCAAMVCEGWAIAMSIRLGRHSGTWPFILLFMLPVSLVTVLLSIALYQDISSKGHVNPLVQHIQGHP